MKKSIIIEIISFLLILLFTYAAVTKFFDYQQFVVQIGQSPLLTAWAGILAWLVPAIELLIVGLLVYAPLRKIGLYASFTLMTLFTAYIVAILQLDRQDIPCSCGGILEAMGWTEHLIFNAAFVVFAAVAVLLHGEYNKDIEREPIPVTMDKRKEVSGKLAEAS